MEKVDLSFKRYWRLLVDYLKPQKGPVILLVALLSGSIGLQLANPQIVRYFLDTAETGRELDKLFGAAALFMSIAIVRQVMQIAVTYVGQNVAWTATNWLRADEAGCNLSIQALTALVYGTHDPGDFAIRGWGDPSPQVLATMRTMFSPRVPYLHEYF